MENSGALREYFDRHHGFGVLATADAAGQVNTAVFARPHVFEDGTLGFVMGDRLTHANLEQNGQASYLFREQPPPDRRTYLGKRLQLRKLREVDDAALIQEIQRRSYGDDRDGHHLVVFEVTRQLPLIGPGGP
jgi:hypothetical protein